MKHKGKKFHTTKRLSKDCYDRNNSRNRCMYTRAKAQGKVIDHEPIRTQYEEVSDVENNMIDRIDDKEFGDIE